MSLFVEGKFFKEAGTGGGSGGGAVDSVNGKTGVVVLSASDVNAVPQYETMPTASASNVGELAQYSGVTIPDVEESATISQTVGSGLTDLQVNVDTFVGVEQPTGDETVNFVASVESSSANITQNPDGETVTITDADLFIAWVKQRMDYFGYDINNWLTGCIHWNGAEWYLFDINVESSIGGGDSTFWAGIGVEIVGTPTGISVDAIYEITSFGGVSWTKNSQTVDLSSYGISYSGTPVDDDTLTVDYTAPVAGITNGYFYKSSVEYSDPTATISQTVGSGLSDLAVNVDTFIEGEQPTQDEEVDFTANVTADNVATSPMNDWVITVDSTAIVNAILALYPDYDLSTITNGWINYCEDENEAILGWNGEYTYQVVVTDGITINVRGQGDPDQYVGIASVDSITKGITTWEKDSETVDLAEYGISYSGTPVDGDTLTVAYTAPAPIGYYWNQTDVQPSSGSGGGSEIEWKTKVDLPAEYAGDEWGAAPYYTIVGGLPDGTYEFYFSTKVLVNDNVYPSKLGDLIFKVKLEIDNSDNDYAANLGYVFNGDYLGGVNTQFGYGKMFWYFVYKNGRDLILYQTESPFSSDALAYNGHQTVPECFKLSAIKNIDTGQEYIAVGDVKLDGQIPTYDTMFSGAMKLNRLVDTPSVPSPVNATWFSANDFATKTIFISRTGVFSVLNLQEDNGNSELVVEVVAKYVDDYKAYSQQIVKATGIFSDCYLAEKGDYFYVMGVDTASAALLSGKIYALLGSIKSGDASVWFDTIPSNTTPIQQVGPQGYNLASITPDGIGNIVQYTGTTNANYTNGYWYKANGTVITTPESLVVTSQDPEFSVSVDLANFKTAIQNASGWSISTIEGYLSNNDNWSLSVVFDENNATVTWASFGFWTTDSQDVLNCVTVTYTGSSSGSTSVNCTTAYTSESKSVQNPSWDRIDVQPSFSPTATTVTLAVADWSSNTQTVNVTGVTANNLVQVAPAPSSTSDYVSGGVLCTAQGAGTLTFTCTTTPSNAITVNVVIF